MADSVNNDIQNIAMDSTSSQDNINSNKDNISQTTMDNNGLKKDYNLDLEPVREPAYMFQSDTGTLSAYHVCRTICNKVGDKYIKGLQGVRNVWRIYFHSSEARIDLITRGIDVDGRIIKVYATNPFMPGGVASDRDRKGPKNGAPSSPRREPVQLVKVWIRDLYDSVADSQITHMLVNVYKIKLSSGIMVGYFRDDNGKLTDEINGDRFVYVHPDELVKPLPRHAQCGKYRCRITYKGQLDEEVNACFICFGTDHQGKNCNNPPCCRVCKQPGHSPGAPSCPHYLKNTNLKLVGGEQDPLSNHYKADFVHNHVKAKTAENHFFYHKCRINCQPELGKMCHDAKDWRSAKYMSKGIRCDKDWDKSDICRQTMKGIMKSKIEQVTPARRDLYDAWINGYTIVEAVPNPRDSWWGSSLDKPATEHTDPKYWPGQNFFGQLYMEIADELFNKAAVVDKGVLGLIDNVCEGQTSVSVSAA